jgi:hypothetical protein
VRGYLGNQGRNRPNKGPRHGGGGGHRERDGNRDPNRGNNGGRHEELPPEAFEVDDSEIISNEELSLS